MSTATPTKIITPAQTVGSFYDQDFYHYAHHPHSDTPTNTPTSPSFSKQIEKSSKLNISTFEIGFKQLEQDVKLPSQNNEQPSFAFSILKAGEETPSPTTTTSSHLKLNGQQHLVVQPMALRVSKEDIRSLLDRVGSPRTPVFANACFFSAAAMTSAGHQQNFEYLLLSPLSPIQRSSNPLLKNFREH